MSETKLDGSDIKNQLRNFTGTENYYKHSLSGYRYTDGIKFLADKANCYWFLDLIFSYNREEPFQIWTLKMNEPKDKNFASFPNGCVVTMKEDSDRKPLVTQIVKYTDFPIKEGIEVWLINGVLILKSEY